MKDQHRAKATDSPSDSKNTTKSIGKVFSKKVISHTDEEWDSMLRKETEQAKKKQLKDDNQDDIKKKSVNDQTIKRGVRT
jgi:hypothetical protein